MSCSYSDYLRAIDELQAMIDISPFNPAIDSKLKSILLFISKRKGPSTLDGLLNYELKEQLISIYFEHKETIDMIYKYIFLKLHFNNAIARNLKEIFVPNVKSYEEERVPTMSEELYMEIILLTIDSENFENNQILDKNFLNQFPQKLNNIKNTYINLITKNYDNLDKFDRDFFENLINNLIDINEEIKGKKKQIKKREKNYNNVNINSVKGIPLKNRTFFYNNEKLIFGEDLYIEYKNYHFPFTDKNKDEFKKQICSFLNSKGGRIYIGISDDKVVYGNLLNYHEKDKNTNEIVNLTYDFFPKCRTKVDVTFIPIKNKNNKYIKNLYVIKIIVSQGDTNTLYSITNKGGFISYLRLKGQCALLTAEEIKNELINRDKNPEMPINPNEFNDPPPDNPELKQANNNYSNKAAKTLENQFKNMNINNSNFNLNNYNQYYNSEDGDNCEEEFDEVDEEGEEDEEDEENDIFDGGHFIPSRGRGTGQRGKGRGTGKGRGRGGGRNEVRKVYPVKVRVSSDLGVYPTISELKKAFNGIKNCGKKFIKKGNKVHGFLNFFDRNEAIAFLRSFQSNNPLYVLTLHLHVHMCNACHIYTSYLFRNFYT